MKLLRHEKILGIITVIFIAFVLIFSLNYKPEVHIAEYADTITAPYLIDINSANAEELDTLEGIGPAIAERIIQYRAENGNFESIDELCEVSGIGPSTLDKIKDYIKI